MCKLSPLLTREGFSDAGEAGVAGYTNKWDSISVRAIAMVRPEPSEQRVLMAHDGIHALCVTKLREL